MVRNWARGLVVVVAACMAAGYAGPLHSYLDLLSAFQLQYLWSFVLLVLLLAVMRSWRWLVLAGIGLLVAGWQVLPWYKPSANVWPNVQPNLRVLLANVCQENRERDAVLRHAQAVDPDLAVFEEIDSEWLAALQPLASDLPHVAYVPGASLRGIAVFSRMKLCDQHVEEFGNPLAPSLVCRVDFGKTPFTLVVTHPWPALDEFGFESRNQQLERVGTYVASRSGPLILLGDLNATMWSYPYRRLVQQTGLLNARRGFGVLPSFPMDKLTLLRFPIDHCLVSPDVGVTECRLGDPAGSDHAPLIVGLAIP